MLCVIELAGKYTGIMGYVGPGNTIATIKNAVRMTREDAMRQYAELSKHYKQAYGYNATIRYDR